MRKSSITDNLTASEQKGAIEAALKGGMDRAEIFKAILQNVYGISKRKKVVIEWGKKMGLDSTESLRIAQGASLIPTSRAPSGESQEKPQRKS